MSFTFRPAVRRKGGLIVGLAGGTGSGKTYSAMCLATGIAGNKPFAVIDTEAGRATDYVGQFSFEHGDLQPPFSPEAYTEAIKVADDRGFPVIVVDSMSHMWAGDGGVLDLHEAELTHKAGDDWQRREACKMAAWVKPKARHKQTVARLLQVRAHLILCFRAEEKVEMVRGADGKMKIVPKRGPTGLDGWMPICEKNLPYELTASFLLTCDKPGFPKPIKLQQQHRAMFPLDQPIGEEAGKAIAAWSGGAKAEPKAEQPTTFAATCITADQAREIGEYAESLSVDMPAFIAWLMRNWSSQKISELPVEAFGPVMEMLEKKEVKNEPAPKAETVSGRGRVSGLRAKVRSLCEEIGEAARDILGGVGIDGLDELNGLGDEVLLKQAVDALGAEIGKRRAAQA